MYPRLIYNNEKYKVVKKNSEKIESILPTNEQQEKTYGYSKHH